MTRTVTMPTESIVTFGKHGIVKVEHTKIAKIEISEESVKMFLGLMGTTIDETLDALDPVTKDIVPHNSKEVKNGKGNKGSRQPILQSTNIVCAVQR